ncbi:hypothetical protein Acr_01g0000250 [Actinidia rufa]|uniref:Uncharacterized protein n=1 Tax=Actinidia rufa TaxID=165716 RepID=A0A7J0E246_9ERIC|nr:hypothetical protein Acr_01g0000250 [Actinidia rufa]
MKGRPDVVSREEVRERELSAGFPLEIRLPSPSPCCELALFIEFFSFSCVTVASATQILAAEIFCCEVTACRSTGTYSSLFFCCEVTCVQIYWSRFFLVFFYCASCCWVVRTIACGLFHRHSESEYTLEQISGIGPEVFHSICIFGFWDQSQHKVVNLFKDLARGKEFHYCRTEISLNYVPSFLKEAGGETIRPRGFVLSNAKKG